MACRSYLFALLLWLGQLASGQDLHVAGRNHLYGYVDHTGAWVIEPQFGEAEDFEAGVARVFVPNKGNAFIDEHGRYLMPPRRFQYLGPLTEGVASFELEEENPETYKNTGFLNAKGEVVIPPRFLMAYEFSEGVAAASVDYGSCGYIDHTGKFVIPPRFHFEGYRDCGSFSEGLAHARLPVQRGSSKAGYIDHSGNWVIPPAYAEAFDFSEGFAVVRLGDLYGFIDKNGVVLGKINYGFAHGFSEDRAAVVVEGKWGFINRKGELVIPPKYDEVGTFSEGRAWVDVNGKRGYVDPAGVLVIPLIYDDAFDFRHGIVGVIQESAHRWTWQVIDKQGNSIPLRDK